MNVAWFIAGVLLVAFGGFLIGWLARGEYALWRHSRGGTIDFTHKRIGL